MADHITKTAVHLDAFQWLGGGLVGFTLPIWAKPLALHTPGDGNLHVPTPDGTKVAYPTDWVVYRINKDIDIMANASFTAYYS